METCQVFSRKLSASRLSNSPSTCRVDSRGSNAEIRPRSDSMSRLGSTTTRATTPK
ncbi:MAG: hypothetical protein IPO22_05670 [Anaerolineales bacterium]|nr:hypothetical protein [Anaerolineales bacterium]